MDSRLLASKTDQRGQMNGHHLVEPSAAASNWAVRRREYDKSLEGLVHRRYRDMKARVIGKRDCYSRWKGLELLPLVDFIRWSLYAVDSEYPQLHERWVELEYHTLSSPSIDRIDSTIGYVIGNMQWLTRSEHMKRSVAARINGRFKV